MFSRYINRKYGDPISVFATGDGGGVLLSSSGFNSLQMHMKPEEALAIAAELTACVEWMRAQSAILTPELDAIDKNLETA